MEIFKRSRNVWSNLISRNDNFDRTTLFFLTFLTGIASKQKFFIGAIGWDIDSSWKQALNLAYKEKLIYGTEIMYTYGPLGFLTTRLADYVPKYPTIILNLFILVAGCHFTYLVISKLKNKILILIFLFSNILFDFSLFYVDAILIFFYSIFYAFLYLKEKKVIYNILPGILCGICLFIKLNTGIIAGFFLFSYSLFLILFKKESYAAIYSLGTFCLVISFFSLTLPIDLLEYVKNSASIIDGYNDAMSAMFGNIWLIPFFSILFCFTYLLCKGVPDFFKSKTNLFLAFSFAIITYVIFKQSFVRADTHTRLFYSMVIPLFSLFYLFLNSIRFDLAFKSLIVPIFIISMVGFEHSTIYYAVRKLVKGPWELKSSTVPLISSEEACRLPSNIKDKIGGSTVDVLGSAVSYIFYNNLKYKPRPVFQSYVAYNESLMNMNYERFIGNSGPEFLLYHFGSIDDRHPFWDEPKIYDAIFINYEIIDTFRSNQNKLFLFSREPQKLYLKEEILMDTIIGWGNKINIPDDIGHTYAKIWYEYSFINKILRFVFQPIIPHITLNYEDKSTSVHSMIKTILPVGVPIENKMVDIDQAYNFFSKTDQGNVKTESLIMKGSKIWFVPEVRVQFVSKRWIPN